MEYQNYFYKLVHLVLVNLIQSQHKLSQNNITLLCVI